MKSTLTILIVTLFTISLSGQDCTTTVSLDPLISLCSPGTTVLSPTINGDFIDFSWEPAVGLSDPSALVTTATVSENIAYLFIVNSLSNTELIVNGDFSQGDTGFTSDYIPGTGGGVGLLSNEGQYAIADNAGDTHNQFANCDDHTNGSGNMMVVNASGDASNIWCQNISVEVNSTYSFSAWVTSVTSQNPAQLQFSVNGVQLGTPFNASANTCNWQNFASEWSSATATSAEICIINSNFTPAGNDFALDDISFRKICQAAANVTIEIVELDAEIAVPNAICSLAFDVDLNDFLTPDTTPGGDWTLDGTPVTTFNPSTLANTNHSLIYTVNNGNCSENSQATFSLDFPATAGIPDFFAECIDPGTSLQVDLSSVLENEDPNGIWELLDGPTSAMINPMTGEFSGTEAGTYRYYYIVAGDAACPLDTVIQTFDLNLNPVADLPAVANLDCIVESVSLGGPNTSLGNNFTYRWSRDGFPLTTSFMPTITVDQAGTYQLEVIDENTFCRDEASVIISSLIGNLDFELSAQAPSCDEEVGAIEAINAIGGSMPYLYSIDGENYSLVPVFNNLLPDNYTIYIQDAGGCEDSLSTNLPAPVQPEVVLQNTGENTLQLGESAVLNLISNPPLELLDTIIWMPELADSNRISDKQWLVHPNETTTYTILVRDESGCEATTQLTLMVRPEGNVYIPNAFSPNEDGGNDRFIVFDQGAIISIKRMMIFDRWGALVYEANDLQANSSDRAWDGRYQGQLLPAGVYIYSAEVEWVNGNTSQLQGEIALVR